MQIVISESSVTSIDSTETLWDIPFHFKFIYNVVKMITRRECYVLFQKNIQNTVTYFMDSFTHSWMCNAKQVGYSSIFCWSCQDPYKVTATHHFTDIHFLNIVSVLVSAGANLLQRYKNVSLDIQKISSHSWCVKVHNTILFYQKSDWDFKCMHKLNNNKATIHWIQYIYTVLITKLKLITTLKENTNTSFNRKGHHASSCSQSYHCPSLFKLLFYNFYLVLCFLQPIISYSHCHSS